MSIYKKLANALQEAIHITRNEIEASDLIGKPLFEICHWLDRPEVTIERLWCISEVVGSDHDGNTIVVDDEGLERTLGIEAFLTFDEAYASLTEDEKANYTEVFPV